VNTLEATSFIPFWPNLVHTLYIYLEAYWFPSSNVKGLGHIWILTIFWYLSYIFQWILTKLSRYLFHTKPWSLFWRSQGQRSRSQLDLSFIHLTVRGYVMLCVAFVIVLSVYYQMFIALQVTVHTWGSIPFYKGHLRYLLKIGRNYWKVKYSLKN
jgi:hypothetical protein